MGAVPTRPLDNSEHAAVNTTPPEPGARLIGTRRFGPSPAPVAWTVWRLPSGDTLDRPEIPSASLLEPRRVRMGQVSGTDQFDDTEADERPWPDAADQGDDGSDDDDQDREWLAALRRNGITGKEADQFMELVELLCDRGVELPEVASWGHLIIALRTIAANEAADRAQDGVDDLDASAPQDPFGLLRMGHGGTSNLRHPHAGIRTYLSRFNGTNRSKKARISRAAAMGKMTGYHG
jgi:hypothetical protein